MADRTVTDLTLIGAWADQYNLLVADVGDKDTLTTTATTVVTAINEVDGLIGDLTSLTTTAQGSVVVSINEVDGLIGDLTSLTTTANSNLVVAVNELDGELNLKAPLASPAFTGTPTAPTQTAGNNTTRLATTAFVQTALANQTHDTADITSGTFANARISSGSVTQHEGDLSITESQISDLGTYATLASPVFTGTPTAPTQAGGNNTTRLATTAFVQGELAGFATTASPAFTGTPTAPTATTGTSTTQIATTQFVAASVAAAGGGDVLKAGTPVDNQIAVWTGDGTIEGDSGLTWTTGTSTLSVGGNAVWHGGNDGAASGLDADLLDGNHGGHYLNFGNFTNLPDPVITLGGDATGSVTLTNLGSATLTVAIVDDSHNHVIGNVDGLQAALDLKAPLTSPAFLTSATLDGVALATETYVDTELASQVHDAADITTGTLLDARIPALAATKITSGTFTTARIPNLATSKITSGTFANARIAQSNVTQHQAALSITESQVSDLGTYSEVATGTTAPATTPDAAGDIFVNTTGDNVYVATGTTNSGDWLQVSGSGNLNNLGDVIITAAATGEFLRYNGAAWVDTTISASDVPSLDASKITSGTFANARISSGSVTQHEGALTITESQISDLGSYVTTTALNLKADISSPAFTGTPTAPTAGAATNNTRIATTAYVTTAISNLVDAAPGTLDTLNELAAALGDDPNFATTITNSIATKAPIASPAFTGTPTAPTQTTGNNTTRLATTAFVQQELNSKDPTITLGGDLTGQATLTNLGSATLNATIASNAVGLGTNTTGHYVATVAGTANEIQVTGSGSETAAVTIGLPDDVSVTGDLTADTIQARVAGRSTATLSTATDANTVVIASGGITVPTGFTARDVVIVLAGASNRTITRGGGLAMYLDGTNEASVTLKANSMMSIVYETSSKCVISGNFV